MHFQVSNSPFSQEQSDLLNRLLPTLTKEQLIWLSGYLTALHGTAPTAASAAVAQTAPAAAGELEPNTRMTASKEVTILYGSQTGNAQKLAKKLSGKLEERGYQITLSAMNEFKTNNLKKLRNLLILVSTHGEGDPPDNALSFYEFLHSKRAPELPDLQFSVLALGDTSYEFFCKTGIDFDRRLEELGGKRLAPRVDCDVDYEEPANEWFESVIAALNATMDVPVPAASAVFGNPTAAEQTEYTRNNPFHAEVLENLNLNGRGSSRETRHLELSLEGSGLRFEPGDSLGIVPENNPMLVDALIEEMGWKPDESVPVGKKGDEQALREALLRHFEITVLTKPLMEQAARLSSRDGLKSLLVPGHEQELKSYMQERDLLDLVRDYNLKGMPAGEFVSMLRKLPARLYSIANSLKANPGEAHLTIRAVRYIAHGRDRFGVCSVQVAERVKPGDTLPVYIHHNPNFKLPPARDVPMIMIGPGTGVAPFRAFLQEWEEDGADGKTWLFFGDQHFRTDFLYQTEWQKWLKSGVLTRMDVAFSRDTDKKVYVQHRMLEKSKELFRWLEDGAYVYVCGDEKHMAHDVHSTLSIIVEREGGMSPEEAAAYLAGLQQQKRYQRDVY